MVMKRQFREDLFFRIQTMTIALPPLRERPEDIRETAAYHVARLCGKFGIRQKEISPEVLDVLLKHRWAGNVRELVHTLERSIAAAFHEPVLYIKHLPIAIRVEVKKNAVMESRKRESRLEAPETSTPEIGRWKNVRETSVLLAEKKYLEDLLSLTGGRIKAACTVSGLSRPRLYSLMKKHKLLKTAAAI